MFKVWTRKERYMSKTPEGYVLEAVCQYLSLRGYFFSRINTTGVFDTGKGIYRKPNQYFMRGVPDIMVWDRGETIFIECKAPKGKQSEEQEIFEDRATEESFTYLLVTDVAELQEAGL
jgi:hypothetical protein